MKEIPIIYCTDMVRATLEDRKTQTRRLRGLEEINKNPDDWSFTGFLLETEDARFVNRHTGEVRHAKNYFGQRGDRLWVRETWCLGDDLDGNEAIYYRATAPKGQYVWKPSIHMFRWASRISLDRTDTRMERVQDIIGFDGICLDGLSPTVKRIMDEGCPIRGIITEPRFECDKELLPPTKEEAMKWWIKLWDSLNAKRGYGWDKNPWVWVIGFRKL